MLELYTSLNPLMLLALLMTAVLAVILQARYTVWLQGGFPQKLFEGLLTAYLMLLALNLRIIKAELVVCTVAAGLYDPWRWGLFAAVAAAGAWAWAKTKSHSVPIGVVLSALSLPIAERLPYGGFTLCLTASILLFILRTYLLFARAQQRRANEITAESVKEAMDVQHSGILFSGKAGELLLVNNKMLALMRELTGTTPSNANVFWERVKGGAAGDLHIIRTDSGVWQFHKTHIVLKNRLYYQTVATDVTEEAKINEKLQQRQEELQRQQAELQAVLGRREELREQDAAAQMWAHIHNLLGQRISVLHRSLKQPEPPDPETVGALLDDLLENLTLPHEDEPEPLFGEIQADLAMLGVRLYRSGAFPQGEAAARLFMNCLREGVANALLHGQAKEIRLDMTETTLSMENDGSLPRSEISFGGGLSAISLRAAELGGSVHIETRPRFCLRLQLPEGEGPEREGDA